MHDGDARAEGWAPIRFVQHGGQRVLVVDFERCSPEEFLRRIGIAKRIIASEPPASVRLLTLCSEAHFNRDVSEAMKRYSVENGPYVARSAVVGATGLRAIILHAVRIATGRDIRPFDDVERAKDWLVKG